MRTKDESDELARVDMKVWKLSSPMADFTISCDKSGKVCAVNIEWDTTKASVEISPK